MTTYLVPQTQQLIPERQQIQMLGHHQAHQAGCGGYLDNFKNLNAVDYNERTLNSPEIRQKCKSQNGYFKKTKHGKFSEKQTFLIYVCVRKKCYFFRKFGVPCFLETPVLRFALLPYYQRNIDDVTTFKLKIEIAKARIFFNIVNIKYFIN